MQINKRFSVFKVKAVYLAILIGLPASLGFTLYRMVKTKIAEDLTVSIPSELKPMSPEDLAIRFPSVRQPIGAFSDDDRMVDFSVNISATQWPDTNLEMAMGFFRAGIYNLYDRVEMMSEGIREIHKTRFIYFEFDSRVNGDQRQLGNQDSILKYTYILYLVERNRTRVFTFTCPQQMKEQWQPVAHNMVKSIRVK